MAIHRDNLKVGDRLCIRGEEHNRKSITVKEITANRIIFQFEYWEEGGSSRHYADGKDIVSWCDRLLIMAP